MPEKPLEKIPVKIDPKVLEKQKEVFAEKPEVVHELHIETIPPEVVEERKELRNEMTVNYLTLFPENSPNENLRKMQDKSKPKSLKAERFMVDKLTLASPYTDIKKKYTNTLANLRTLRDFLIGKLGEKEGNFWIRATLSNDAQVRNQDNPFVIVRKSVFSSPKEDFLSIIERYEYVVNTDVIEIKAKHNLKGL